MKKSSYLRFGRILVIGFAVFISTALVANEPGLYVHGGMEFFNGLDGTTFKLRGALQTETIEEEYEIDGSRIKPVIGLGYNVNKQWGFEFSYVAVPERVALVEDLEVLVDLPDGVQASATTTTRSLLQLTSMQVSAVYYLEMNENLSLFAKAGIAFTETNTGLSGTLSSQNELIGTQTVRGSRDDSSNDAFGSIGVCVPLPLTMVDASLTFAVQLLETPEELETSFKAGVQVYF